MTQTPPQPVPYYSGPPLKPYRDLRAGSRAFGVASLLLGCLSGFIGLAAPLALSANRHGRPTPMHTGAAVSGTLNYLGLALAGIVFGLGAVRLRRWVRPFGTIGGVLGILGGIEIVFSAAFSLSAIEADMRSRRAATHLTSVSFTVAFLVIVLLGIITPALFFWFFRKPQVREMLDHYDPSPCWTDRYPFPVLSVAMALTLLGLTELLSAPHAIAPMFGKVFTGLPAIGARLALGAITLSLVPLVLQRRPGGWWGSLALGLLLSVAYGATIFRPDLIDQYRRAGFSETQLEAMETRGVAGELASVVPQAIFALGYLIYVRRYFDKKSPFPHIQSTTSTVTPPVER